MKPLRRKISPPPIPPPIHIRAVCPECGQSFGSQYGWVTCPECKTEFAHFREEQEERQPAARPLSITLTCPNPNCQKRLKAPDKFAGKAIRCPGCGMAITVTSATAVPSHAPPPIPPLDPLVRPDSSVTHVPPDSGGGLWDAIQRKGRIYELDRASLRILSCGLVALALLSFSSFLPWASLSSGFFRLNLLGVQTGVGLFVLFLSLGVGIFVGVAFALQRLAFEISVYTGAGWGLFASLWLLVSIVNVASTGLVVLGVGLCFAFLCSLGVAGTFGLVAIHLLRRRASAEPAP